MKKLLLLLAMVLALAGIVGAIAPKASAGTTTCYLYPGMSCITPWNYWSGHNVINNSSTGVEYCISYHTDGSVAGAYGTIEPGHTRFFWSGGYNRMACRWYSGGYPIVSWIVSG